MRVKLTILLLSIIAWSATSRAQDAEATLKQFEGRTLILRHPFDSSSQRYDAEGRVLKGGGKEGSWAVLSGVLIDRITLTPDNSMRKAIEYFSCFQNKSCSCLSSPPQNF